ncbi:MAG: hypothetical protein ACKOBB_07210, partial [Acidimicrobiaceae bacterium]
MSVPRERATGVVTPSTWAIMQSNLIIKPRRIADSPSHVEIYLPEQVMIVFKKDEPVLITHISSGTGVPWCEEVKIDPGEEGNKHRMGTGVANWFDDGDSTSYVRRCFSSCAPQRAWPYAISSSNI